MKLLERQPASAGNELARAAAVRADCCCSTVRRNLFRVMFKHLVVVVRRGVVTMTDANCSVNYNSMMRLGISGWRLCVAHTGIARYLLNVIRHWTPDATSVFREITIYTTRPLDRGRVLLPANIRERVLAPHFPMVAWENLRLAVACKDDVLFCPSFSRPLFVRGRTVVATHDMVYHVRPDMFPRSVRTFYRPLYDWSDRHAALIITDAEAVKREIVRYCGVAPTKVRVTYLAPADCFGPLGDRSLAEPMRAKHVGVGVPFFLFVGKMSGRRSMSPLLEAFALFKRRTGLPHRLLLVGLNPHNLDLHGLTARLGIEDDVRYSSFVTDQELNALYNAAEAFVMPSIYETTSLPVMEAQATGAPVICLDTEGMRDITGNAALMFPRLEPAILSEAMTRLVAEPALREQLRTEGLANSARFSWKRCAAETMAVMEEAALM